MTRSLQPELLMGLTNTFTMPRRPERGRGMTVSLGTLQPLRELSGLAATGGPVRFGFAQCIEPTGTLTGRSCEHRPYEGAPLPYASTLPVA